jgi:hypothetical protein
LPAVPEALAALPERERAATLRAAALFMRNAIVRGWWWWGGWWGIRWRNKKWMALEK